MIWASLFRRNGSTIKVKLITMLLVSINSDDFNIVLTVDVKLIYSVE